MNRGLFVAALCSALLSVSVRADDTVRLGEVVVTDTGQPASLQKLPDNTRRVDPQTLTLIDETHPAQIFTVVPGAWVTAGGGQESLMALRSPLFTGQGACGAFLLLTDGIPIQPAGFCNVNALFELNTEQAQSVEVIRGPGSVLYGTNALHGIVNVLTRSADFAPARSASLEHGSNDYTRFEAGIGHGDAADGLRVDANAAHDGGFRADSGFDQQKFDLRLDHDDGRVRRETLFAGTNLNQKTAGYLYGLDAYRDESLRDSNPTPGAYRDSQNWLLAQRWQVRLADGDSVELTPYARRNTMAFVEHYIPGEPVEEDAQNSGGFLLTLRTQLSASTEMIDGVDGEYVHGATTEYQPLPLTTGTPEQQATRPSGYHYDFTADSRTLAGYVHLTHQWSPEWLVSGGVRVEGVRYSYVNFLPSGDTRDDGTPCGFGGCLFNRPADRSDSFVNVLPKFGVAWLATPAQTVYANVGRGARAPEVSELYELQQQQDVADLHSETMDAYELGWRGHVRRLSWDADVYDMLKDHFIFRDSNGFNVSDGRTRHRGVEFSLDAALSDDLHLLLDGTYAIHSYAFSATLAQGNTVQYGDDMKYAPRSLGSLRLRWSPGDATTLEAQILHVGGYWLDESDSHRYGGQDLVNLSVVRGLGAGCSLALHVHNLADVSYAERADYSFGNYRYFPGDGRELFLELAKDW